MERENIGRRVGDLALAVVLTAAMLGAGLTKLSGLESHRENFLRWGFPEWALSVVGLIEVLSAIGLWMPKIRAGAPVAIMAVMTGAVATHVIHGEAGQALPATVLLLLAAVLGHLRRDAFFALLRRH